MEKSITINSLKINYRISGHGDPLIILHGWGICMDHFVKLQRELSDKFQVFTIDLPGFGKSDLPKWPWEVGDYSQFVNQFTEKLELGRFYLFGHSFGGRISIKFAVLYPERLKGLILCSSAGIKPKNTFKKAVFLSVAKAGRILLSIPKISGLKPVARKLLYKAAREHDYEKLNNKIMQESFKKVVNEDLKPLLSKIKTNTLLLWGMEDKMTPLRDGELMNQKIRNSKMRIFEGVGHRLPYERPGEVAEEIVKFFG